MPDGACRTRFRHGDVLLRLSCIALARAVFSRAMYPQHTEYVASQHLPDQRSMILSLEPCLLLTTLADWLSFVLALSIFAFVTSI